MVSATSLADARSAEVALDAAIARALVFVLFFAVAGFNGRPFVASAGLASLATLPLLYFAVAAGRGQLAWKLDGGILLLVGLALLQLASLLANLDRLPLEDALLIIAFGGFIPLFAYAAARGNLADPRLASAALYGLMAGIVLRFGFALFVYWQEWGIPSLTDLLWSRYDQVRIAGFANASFGNTSSTSGMLALIMPVIIGLLYALPKDGDRRLRWLCGLGLALAILIAVITQSRALILTLGLMLAFIAFAWRSRLLALLPVALLIGAILAAPLLAEIDTLIDRFSSVVTADAGADNSVSERIESIEIGWQRFLDKPWFGAGFGFSQLENSHFNAHQMNVDLAHELGISGLIWSSLLLLWTGVTTAGSLIRVRRAGSSPKDGVRLALHLGCLSFLIYGAVGNTPLADGLTNNWLLGYALFMGFAAALAPDGDRTA